MGGTLDSPRTALRVTGGPAVGRLIVVDDELRLGSSEPGDAHALVLRDPAGSWIVRDLGSEQGTLLNGQPLTDVAPLHRGDTLRVGNTRLLVVDGAVRLPTPRPVTAEPAPATAEPAPAPEGPRPPWLAAADPEPPIFAPATVPEPAPLPPAPRLADRIAPYRMRGLAFLTDSFIAGGIALATYLALGRSLFTALLAIALILCWDFLFESLRSQTIGKRIMKIRVVRRDGSLLRPQHVAARNVLRLIDNVLFATLSIILSGESRRQRLGDLAAGTIVVKSERMMSRLPSSGRDRFVLGAYPIVWIAPVVAFALLVPSARLEGCKNNLLSDNPSEKTCLVRFPDGRTAALSAVNPGHTLHWNGTDVRLLATRAQASTAVPGSETLVAFELSVRNTTAQPVRFDVEAVRLILNIPDGSGSVASGRELDPALEVPGYRPIEEQTSIAAGATRVGWARFAVPASFVDRLGTRAASITFFPLVPGPGLPRVGNIRLWHPANAQGAAAARVVFR